MLRQILNIVCIVIARDRLSTVDNQNFASHKASTLATKEEHGVSNI
jgi:hypothetical protein